MMDLMTEEQKDDLEDAILRFVDAMSTRDLEEYVKEDLWIHLTEKSTADSRDDFIANVLQETD